MRDARFSEVQIKKDIFRGGGVALANSVGGGGVLVLNYISRLEISRSWHLCVFYIELNLVDTLYFRDFPLIGTSNGGGKQLSDNGKVLSKKKTKKHL